MNSLSYKVKKPSLLHNIINKFRFNQADKEAKNIIERFKYCPNFPAYTADYVKFLSHLICEKDPDMCVFFADGDNIGIANELATEKANIINTKKAKELGLPDVSYLDSPISGEHIVNLDLTSILKQIENINNSYGYQNALVGKNGDEFFIAIPHMKPDDIEKINTEYNQVKSGLVSISVGYCNDMSNGVCSAFMTAEQRSSDIKSQKKHKNYKTLFKNADALLEDELNKMLKQLRVHVNELTEAQKNTLKDTISKSFEISLRTPRKILEDSKVLLTNSSDTDFIKQRVTSLDNKLQLNSPSIITDEERRNFILSNILTQTPIENVPKIDYFLQQNHSKLISSSKSQTFKKLKNQALVTVDLSGIKDINDTYGHTECDEMVYSTIDEIQELVDSTGFKKKSSLFAHNISSYSFIISNKDLPLIDTLESSISKYVNSEFKLAISATQFDETVNQQTLHRALNDPNQTSEDIFNLLLSKSYTHNTEQNKSKISVQKVNDKKAISRYIARNITKITESLGKKLSIDRIDSTLSNILGIDNDLALNSLLEQSEHSNTYNHDFQNEK